MSPHINSRALGYVAAAAWAFSVLLLLVVVSTDHMESLHGVQLFVLVVASTTSIAAFIYHSHGPVDEAFDLGYTAGWTDREVSGRPIVLPRQAALLRRAEDKQRMGDAS